MKDKWHLSTIFFKDRISCVDGHYGFQLLKKLGRLNNTPPTILPDIMHFKINNIIPKIKQSIKNPQIFVLHFFSLNTNSKGVSTIIKNKYGVFEPQVIANGNEEEIMPGK